MGKCLENAKNPGLRLNGYIGFIEFGVFTETLDVFIETPGVFTKMAGVFTETADVYTASLVFKSCCFCAKLFCRLC